MKAKVYWSGSTYLDLTIRERLDSEETVIMLMSWQVASLVQRAN